MSSYRRLRPARKAHATAQPWDSLLLLLLLSCLVFSRASTTDPGQQRRETLVVRNFRLGALRKMADDGWREDKKVVQLRT